MASAEARENNLSWRKSQRSATNGECIEVAPLDGRIIIRDSKSPDGPFLQCAGIDWRRFVERTKESGFGPLT